MARPKGRNSPADIPLTAVFTREDVAALESFVSAQKISRSKLMRTAIRAYLKSAPATVTAA